MSAQKDLSPLESAIASLEHGAVAEIRRLKSIQALTPDLENYWSGKLIALTQAQSILADLYATEPLADVLATLDR